MGEISSRITSVRSNNGETSDSSSLQRQKNTSMAPNPRENLREGRVSRETSGRLAYVGEISPRIASVPSNTGEFATAPKRYVDGTKPEREFTGMTHFQRDLWKAGVCRRDYPKYSFYTIEY